MRSHPPLASLLILIFASTSGCDVAAPPSTTPTSPTLDAISTQHAEIPPVTEAHTSPASPTPPPPSARTLARALRTSALAASRGATAPTPPQPLPDIPKLLQGLRADPEPEAITRDLHYVVSNESRHYFFEEIIRDRGGLFIGLGTDQNYLLAGWAKPDVMILFDFDQYVVDLHEVYGALFVMAHDADAFLTLWSHRQRKQTLAALASHFASHPRRDILLQRFKVQRQRILKRMRWIIDTYRDANTPTFLSDPAQYQHIRTLWLRGRVRSIRGDLREPQALSDIATLSRQLQMPVRLFYFSNAMDYFTWDVGTFRQNITQLPFDDTSLVLYTRPINPDTYRYLYQRALDFQALVASKRVNGIRALTRFSRRHNKHSHQRVVEATVDDLAK